MMIQRFFQSSRACRWMFIVMPSIYLSFWLVMSVIFIFHHVIMVIPSLVYLMSCVFILSGFTYRYELTEKSVAGVCFINNVIFNKLKASILVWLFISLMGVPGGLIGIAISTFVAMMVSGLLFLFSYCADFNLIAPLNVSLKNKKVVNSFISDVNESSDYFFDSKGLTVATVCGVGMVGIELYENESKETEYEYIDSVDINQSNMHFESINPGSGLPMMDEYTDISGNPYGSHGFD
ncbi:hypothetical protein [Yersinia mollaretii]|uniref:hypothetical protein n=1 Tax=Yersinia mollaretii TaxID=33060 RepID=UPI00119E5DFA|nr:hypothetical protein [Yersinia mollaretii]